MKSFLTTVFVCGLIVQAAAAPNLSRYAGTWTGRVASGKTVQVTIPEGVASGEAGSYVFDGQDQGPQTPTVQGSRIRFDNPSGSYFIVGPLKGDRLPYVWTDGSHKASATLMRN